ncbi:hypothetical protein [Streptomyces litchfieldiae]|uniref:Uncharacterized protein n=1 Tax=Streptomyces litchfieldiae TaxID=3075543 RepID=A0ABU2MT52_9ACTN|nr:hypothetical protein [Streptomyces sp. DSM 44938]MDT0344641.1 hypothetical protein [Streptomyces sp. DSM 44938]
MQFVGPARPTVTGTLRVLEGVLLRGGRRRALRNARTAVLQDRARAAARRDAERALAAASERVRPAVLPAPRP